MLFIDLTRELGQVNQIIDRLNGAHNFIFSILISVKSHRHSKIPDQWIPHIMSIHVFKTISMHAGMFLELAKKSMLVMFLA